VKCRYLFQAAAGALIVAAAALVPLGVTPASPATTTAPKSGCAIPATGAWQITSRLPCRATAPAATSVSFNLNSHFRWSVPTSSSSAVTISATRVAPGGMIGTLHAVSAGTAVLRAVGVMVCPAGKACPALAMSWTLRVTVVAASTGHVTVTATQANSGGTVTIREGDLLNVTLSGPTLNSWSEPTATDSSVLDRISATAGHAIFIALGTGTATVTAIEHASCYPKCLAPARIIQIHVVVTR
jgi:hypothetical protein